MKKFVSKETWDSYLQQSGGDCYATIETFQICDMNKIVIIDKDCSTQVYEPHVESIEGKKYWKGYIQSSDNFYSDYSIEREPVKYDLLCAEMESFGLFANARHLGKKAACILTISDSIVNKTETTAEQRQTGFVEMMEIALGAAITM